MTDSERINKVIEYTKLSVKAFSESLGLQRADRIYHIQKGRNKISSDLARLITTKYNEINYTWLLKGIGVMLNTSNSTHSELVVREDTAPYVANAQAMSGINFMFVPLINQYAYAGFMSGYSDPMYIENLPKIPFIVDQEYKGHYLCFEVKGDSMDDGTKRSLEAGNILLCREIYPEYWKSKLHIKQWDAFVIAHRTEGICVKQIIDHDVEKGIITCHSYNPLFEDFKVSLSEVVKLYNVVQVLKNM